MIYENKEDLREGLTGEIEYIEQFEKDNGVSRNREVVELKELLDSGNEEE